MKKKNNTIAIGNNVFPPCRSRLLGESYRGGLSPLPLRLAFSASLQQANKCKARLLLNELQFVPAKAARFRTHPLTLLLGLVVLGMGMVPQLGQDGAGRCGDTAVLQHADSPVPGAAEFPRDESWTHCLLAGNGKGTLVLPPHQSHLLHPEAAL